MGISINRLLVSEALFGAAIAAVRRHSVRTGRFVSLSEVIEAAASDPAIFDLNKATIETWLSIDQHGTIPITLVIRDRWRTAYERARKQLSELAGQTLSARQMLVILANSAGRSAGRH